MVAHSERLKAFVKLGAFLSEFVAANGSGVASSPSGNHWHNRLRQAVQTAGEENGWFTRDNVNRALAAWGSNLTPERLGRWLSSYTLSGNRKKKVALIMAGNIPLVGFHDLLSVLITGNSALLKPSSNDRVLLPLLMEYLLEQAPGLEGEVSYSEGPLSDYDAVIATGSNNTSRYFEYYFGRKPHLIRRNRNSVAVLTGEESTGELQALGEDIFSYFGLGCRNVSKLFVPGEYDFEPFFQAIREFSSLSSHRKYGNNYDYNKAVYLMSAFPFLDNGFLLLKEDAGYSSPIATLFYERYENSQELQQKIAADRDTLQCVVGSPQAGGDTAFGTSQVPELWEYADGVDTVDFLLKT